MNKLIIDVEATCSKDGSIDHTNTEIIEIGAVLIDSNGYWLGHYSSFVKPKINPTLTKFCKKLTGISQNDVDKAPPFNKVLVELQDLIFDEFNGEPYQFCSWSDFDKRIVNDEILRYNANHTVKLNNHITHYYVDLQKAFSKKHKLGKRRMSVEKALIHLGMEFVGDQHRAIDDAINTARIALYGDGITCTT